MNENDKPKHFSEVVAEMKRFKTAQSMVYDWQKYLPAGSRWFPGCPGDPKCTTCQGTGFLRMEGLSISNPYFGRVLLCDCVKFK